MSNLWHYEHDGQQFGPVSPEALKQLARAGRLKPTDLIWQAGTDRKVPASRAKGLFPPATPRPKPMLVATPISELPANDEPPPLPAVEDEPPPLPASVEDEPPPLPMAAAAQVPTPATNGKQGWLNSVGHGSGVSQTTRSQVSYRRGTRAGSGKYQQSLVVGAVAVAGVVLLAGAFALVCFLGKQKSGSAGLNTASSEAASDVPQTLEFVCPNGHQIRCPADQAGKVGKCPICGVKFRVPTLPQKEPQIEFLCPNGHHLHAPVSLQGQPGVCPECGSRFRIPVLQENSAMSKTSQPDETRLSSSNGLDTSGQITAMQLSSDYSADAIAADGKYKGRVIRVAGIPRLGGAQPDAKRGTVHYEILRSTEPQVRCLFEDAAEADKVCDAGRDSAVVIEGRCQGIVTIRNSYVVLRECKFLGVASADGVSARKRATGHPSPVTQHPRSSPHSKQPAGPNSSKQGPSTVPPIPEIPSIPSIPSIPGV